MSFSFLPARRALAATLTAALAFAGALASQAAHAEGRIRIAEQFGIGYLPLHVIRDHGLIEKHGKAQGLDIAVEWAKLGGGATVNDALCSRTRSTSPRVASARSSRSGTAPAATRRCAPSRLWARNLTSSSPPTQR